MLQAAIDQTAGARVPLMLGPGDYRVGGLKLPSGTQIIGVRGATQARLHRRHADDRRARRRSRHARGPGARRRRPSRCRRTARSFISRNAATLRIVDCEVVNSGRSGIRLDAVGGIVSGTTVTKAADVAIYSLDAHGLVDPGQRRARRRQRRHPGSPLGEGRRRHAGHRQPHRGHRQRKPAAPASTATPSTCSAPATSSCAATASAARRSRRCAATPPPTSRSSATPRPTSARSRSIPSSASRAR